MLVIKENNTHFLEVRTTSIGFPTRILRLGEVRSGTLTIKNCNKNFFRSITDMIVYSF